MRHLLIAALVGTAACGGSDAQSPDAAGDAPDADATVDAGPCTGREFQLEYVDWDSTSTSFLGIANAKFTVDGIAGRTSSTAPNGRLIACVPTGAPAKLTVDAPGTYVEGTVVLDEAALTQTARTISFRSFTAERAATFYQSRGLTYDATRAHILVLQTGSHTALLLNRPYGALVGGEATADGAIQWGMDGGSYELFTNVVPDATGVARISGTPDGDREVPIVAGQLTLVAVHFTF